MTLQDAENQGLKQEQKKPCDKTQGVLMDVNRLELLTSTV